MRHGSVNTPINFFSLLGRSQFAHVLSFDVEERNPTFFNILPAPFPSFSRACHALLLSWSRKGTDQCQDFSHEEDFSYDHCWRCSLSSTSRRLPIIKGGLCVRIDIAYALYHDHEHHSVSH